MTVQLSNYSAKIANFKSAILLHVPCLKNVNKNGKCQMSPYVNVGSTIRNTTVKGTAKKEAHFVGGGEHRDEPECLEF